MSLTVGENRSMTTSSVVLPSDSGRSVGKSMAMCDHSLIGVGKGSDWKVPEDFSLRMKVCLGSGCWRIGAVVKA